MRRNYKNHLIVLGNVCNFQYLTEIFIIQLYHISLSFFSFLSFLNNDIIYPNNDKRVSKIFARLKNYNCCPQSTTYMVAFFLLRVYRIAYIENYRKIEIIKHKK